MTISAWFLTDSKGVKLNKIIGIILDVVFWSWCCWLFLKLLGMPVTVGRALFFPISAGNNWYVACYLILYSIHPALNKVLRGMEQYEHFKLVVVGTLIYSVWQYVMKGSFWSNELMTFIWIYFCVAYVKKYGANWNYKAGVVLSSVLLLIMFVTLNILGQYCMFASHWLEIGAGMKNPLIVIFSISLVKIFLGLRRQSKSINVVGSVTLLIYIIHEDINIRTYIKPQFFVMLAPKCTDLESQKI